MAALRIVHVLHLVSPITSSSECGYRKYLKPVETIEEEGWNLIGPNALDGSDPAVRDKWISCFPLWSEPGGETVLLTVLWWVTVCSLQRCISDGEGHLIFLDVAVRILIVWMMWTDHCDIWPSSKASRIYLTIWYLVAIVFRQNQGNTKGADNCERASSIRQHWSVRRE